jgi:hypothetical protein
MSKCYITRSLNVFPYTSSTPKFLKSVTPQIQASNVLDHCILFALDKWLLQLILAVTDRGIPVEAYRVYLGTLCTM